MPTDPPTTPNFDDLPTSSDTLLRRLDALGIAHKTITHVPVYTVEESKTLRGELPGGHSKNLFLRDKKKRSFLAVLLEDRDVDLKTLEQKMGAGRLSFGSPDRLKEFLGVIPGSVTPFAMINDVERRVAFHFDRGFLDFEVVNFHPLRNDMTTAISPQDVLKFVEACGHEVTLLDL